MTKGLVVYVDDEDFIKLNKYKWYPKADKSTTYAVRFNKDYSGTGSKLTIPMHRELMGFPVKKVIDHIDGNGLNNCKSNLRICTQQQNKWNKKKQKGDFTSKYVGVCWNVAFLKWEAYYYHYNVKIAVGYFDDERKAAIERDIAVLKKRPEFTNLNILKRKGIRKKLQS